MIELPSCPAPNGASPSLYDRGYTVEGAAGGASLRVDRPGSRYRIAVTYPVMDAETARIFVSRLIRAKSQGLRIPYPLQGVNQGSAGAPVVDGADQQGTSIAIRNCTPGHRFKEGYWLSIEGADGQHYLDNIAATVDAGADGTCTLPLSLPLRTPFADGAAVHAAKPMIEGLVEGDEVNWNLALAGLAQLSFAIREAE